VDRSAIVPAFAKLNLSLLVLGKREDGYHELRSVFQSISLADRIHFTWTPGARWGIEATPEIPNNLVVRAAEALRAETGLRGRLKVHIEKRIPMGGGLGGGSSNAAALLLALPALAGIDLPDEVRASLALAIGSDVPYFLEGGTQMAFGRGEELYDLPPVPEAYALVALPGVSVSTPEAFRDLGRSTLAGLTFIEMSNRLKRFRALVGELCAPAAGSDWRGYSENDFEPVVFRRIPLLSEWRERLSASGAKPARMSGSGSALYGIYRSEAAWKRAARRFRGEPVEAVRLLTRKQYRSAWLRALGEHKVGTQWPPRSPYGNPK
jgi:4-diphosphocytidyl-2-C-methyl-D-erythritol kinase